MARGILYAALCLVLLFYTPEAQARDSVRVRMEDHNGYSRMVLAWPARVPYTAENNQGALSFAFEKDAALSAGSQHQKTLRNITGFQALSSAPFNIAVRIPPDSRVRHFFAGNRLIVDVYDSPQGIKNDVSAPSPPPRTVAKKPAAQPKTQAAPRPEKITPPKKEEEPEPPIKTADATKTAVKPADEKEKETDKEETTPKQTPLEPPVTAPPIIERPARYNSVISLSTTQITGLAAFQVKDRLMLVNDKEDLVARPKITGTGETLFKPAGDGAFPGGTLYTYDLQARATLRGEGGGLLWRVVGSQNADMADPAVKPDRQAEKNSLRGGTMVWPLREPSKILDVEDPITGSIIKVVTVKNAQYFAGPPRDFIDFQVLPSFVGMAIRPKVDDLSITITPVGIEISRPGGLSLSHEHDVLIARTRQNRAEQIKNAGNEKTVFDFQDWGMGPLSALDQNQTLMMASLNDLPQASQVEGFLKLAKLYLAQAHAAESLGFLDLAIAALPQLKDNPQYAALRGAAHALAWESEEAFGFLSKPSVNTFSEIGYWKAYALADLGDWAQAHTVLPKDLSLLKNYPDLIFNRLAPVIAEVLLRAGDSAGVKPLLERMDKNRNDLFTEQKAALAYLKGETARQDGDTEQTIAYWEPLVTGQDDLYRAKAGLALAHLLADKKKIPPAGAIDRLERLRYAWRGDDLETQIHYQLGKMYYTGREPGKALNILREAASHAVNPTLAQRITTEMRTMFAAIFMEDLSEIQPEDAVALYEQFAELIPAGGDGNTVVENLADHLIENGLPGRASAMLSHQLKHRLEGKDAYRVGMRLAEALLADDNPADALAALEKAEYALNALPAEDKSAQDEQALKLKRARALTRDGHPDQALLLLETLDMSPPVNRLRADIAWHASFWDDAADALQEVITDENISSGGPLNDAHATLLLHRGVALNLADDRIGLANHREKYADAMAGTARGDVFDVITRPRQQASLADRETLMSIVSETDLFAGFLEKYNAP